MKASRAAILALLGFTFLVGIPTPSTAVQATATDGEATVYVLGDFESRFDLAYKFTLHPDPVNTSWGTLGIMLIGVKSNASVEIGVSQGYPNPLALAAFTSVSFPGNKNRYRSFPKLCNSVCRVELRGDKERIQALVGHRVIGEWPRRALQMVKPYVQLNAEVSKPGDKILGRLLPLQTTANGRGLPFPMCAFTTKGIEARRVAAFIDFFGMHQPSARVTYFSLKDGTPRRRCD